MIPQAPEGMGDPGEMGWGSPERGKFAQSEVLAFRTSLIEMQVEKAPVKRS